jgi:hypothetical protein
MGRVNHDQRQLFYSFCLEDAVPQDHLVRAIARVLDLSWVHSELAPHYSKVGRPSIDPVLMIRMLVIGYVFAIHGPYAGKCKSISLIGGFAGFQSKTRSQTILRSHVYVTSGFATVISSALYFERVVDGPRGARAALDAGAPAERADGRGEGVARGGSPRGGSESHETGRLPFASAASASTTQGARCSAST